MPVWAQAGGWGLLAGGALVVGALVAWFVRVPQHGRGLGDGLRCRCADLGPGVRPGRRGGDDGRARGRRWSASSAAPWPTCREHRPGPARGAAPQALRGPAALRARAAGQRDRDRHRCPARRRAGVRRPRALPARRQGVGIPVLAAIFISNLPEGLSSAAGMKRTGRSAALRLRRVVRHRGASGAAGRSGVLLLQGPRRAGRGDHRAGRRRDPGDGGRHDDPGGVRAHPPLRRAGRHVGFALSFALERMG